MPNKDEGIVSLAHDYAGQLATPDKRLLASWQRSEEYGVSAEEVDPMWAGSTGTDSLFFQCGQEVLTGLYSTLANEPLSLMLTDAKLAHQRRNLAGHGQSIPHQCFLAPRCHGHEDE